MQSAIKGLEVPDDEATIPSIGEKVIDSVRLESCISGETIIFYST